MPDQRTYEDLMAHSGLKAVFRKLGEYWFVDHVAIERLKVTVITPEMPSLSMESVPPLSPSASGGN